MVTVILPVYNGAEFLASALASACSQAYRELEILVVDDGSTDGSRAIVEEQAVLDKRIRLISQPNAGVASARNRALAEARGEFIAPLDADDLWQPEKIERQVRRLLAAGEQTAFVYCWWVWIGVDGKVLDRSPCWKIGGSVLEKLVFINFTGSASVPLFRRACLQQIGGYNERLVREQAGGCEDWEAVLRLAEHFHVAFVPEVLLGYRRRPGSMSSAAETMRRSQEKVLGGVRQRHPEIDSRLFRASANNFALYLAGRAFWSGKQVEAFRWAFRAGFRVPLLASPYVLRLLLLPRHNSKAQTMLPDVRLDTARLPEPLLPYDRLGKLPQLPRMLRQIVHRGTVWLVPLLQRVLQEALLLPLRWESFLRQAVPCEPRVLALACWHFPIYSQTFVYREMVALARAGFTLRFAYSGLTSRSQLPDECALLWQLKRRILLSEGPAEHDLKRYRKRMPDQFDQIVREVSEASGLSAEEVIAHRHFRQAFSFTRVCEIWKPNYIHTYFFYEAALFGYVAASLLGIPRGVSCYADHMVDDYELKLATLHARTADLIVATSERIRQELESLAGHSLPQAVVKPNGIDASLFKGVERQTQPATPVLRAVAVNRIHPKKGCMCLVQAAHLLHERGVPITIAVLGEYDNHDPAGSAYFEDLKQYVAVHGLDEVIRFHGRQTGQQVRQRLEEADLFLAPFVELANGDKDGIPTALLEAMAAGCAIVTTDAGSIPEVIDDGIEGLRVPQGDAAALAAAMERLVEDQPLRKRLANAAVMRVQEQFDVSHCEEIFHRRLLILLGRPVPARQAAVAS